MNGENGYDEDWIDYYVYLEGLRQSGVTNMFGASPYLAKQFGIGQVVATKVLSSWMKHYDALLKDGIITRGE